MRVDANIFAKMPESFRALCAVCNEEDNERLGRIVRVLSGQDLPLENVSEVIVRTIIFQFNQKKRRVSVK